MIYLDHAATTPVDPKVLQAMRPYFTEKFYNASSVYNKAKEVRNDIETARETVAKTINCQPKEIIFTSGGTESDTLAIKGICERAGKGHIITTKYEHHAVLNTCQYLEQKGYKLTYLTPDRKGIISPKQLEEAIQDDTILVTVIYGNNEIGTILPIAKFGEICRDKNIPLHIDACQAAGQIDIDVEKLKVDLMTINGSKLYGPKGVGALYVRSGINIIPQQIGGSQEGRRRAGTENTPAIIGLATALELAKANQDKESARLIKLRDYFIKELTTKISDINLNGDAEKRLPNNINISVKGIEGESMLMRLDMESIQASTGSACSSGNLNPSHVLLSIGLSHEQAHGSLRFSLGKSTTKEQLDIVVEKLQKIVADLRMLSPIYSS